MTRPNAEHGDRSAPAREILRTLVGSGVHGIAIDGQDDRDEMGVYIPTLTAVTGLRPVDEHYVWRTQPEGARSGPGDTDLVCYSLRKYLQLVTKGNPTALLPLYAPARDVLGITDAGRELRVFGPTLLSQQAGWRFLGYMQAQRERLTGGGKRNRVPNRPELVARHGYDSKYAAHALRLALQGLEVVRDGRLTLPLPDAERELVRSVKLGDRALDEVTALIDSAEDRLRRLLDSGSSPLPVHPDLDVADAWLAEQHLRAWASPPAAVN